MDERSNDRVLQMSTPIVLTSPNFVYLSVVGAKTVLKCRCTPVSGAMDMGQ